MTPKQREMLLAFLRDGEAADLYDFDAAGTLGWRNRERVIDACRRRGWLNDDGITESGRQAVLVEE